MANIKENQLDKRIVARVFKAGRLDKKLYQKHLDELPDLSDRVQNRDASHEPARTTSARDSIE